MFMVEEYQSSDRGSIMTTLAPTSSAMALAFFVSYSFCTRITFNFSLFALSISSVSLEGVGSFPSNSTGISSSP